MLLLARGPPCLCNRWAAESQRSPADKRQAAWVSFKSSQLVAFIQATHSAANKKLQWAPRHFWTLQKQTLDSPQSTKTVSGPQWSLEQEVWEYKLRNIPENLSLLSALINTICNFFQHYREVSRIYLGNGQRWGSQSCSLLLKKQLGH